MKLIKKGNLDLTHNPQTFKCKKCGCIFEALDNEYTYADCFENGHDGIYAKCNCPCCGDTVYLYENEKKQNGGNNE